MKDLGLDQFRKTLEFKAAVMPDFSSPFKPSAAKAKGVTQSQVGLETLCHAVMNVKEAGGFAVSMVDFLWPRCSTQRKGGLGIGSVIGAALCVLCVLLSGTSR